MGIAEYKYLTPAQRAHFLQHGWVRIPRAVEERYREAFTADVWVRLGYDPADKATWEKEKVSIVMCPSYAPWVVGGSSGVPAWLMRRMAADPHAAAPRGADAGVHAQGVGRDVCVSLLPRWLAGTIGGECGAPGCH